MIQLILLRHGNTFEENEVPRFIGSRTDLPLTAYGKEQSERSARYLSASNLIPDVIFHGPLLRQKQTAAIAAETLSVRNIIETEELEEIDYGLWENLSAEEIKKNWTVQFDLWNENGIWQEGIFGKKEDLIISSIESWMKKLLIDYKTGTVLAVTSNGVLRTLNKIILRGSYNHSQAKVSTAGICILNYSSMLDAEIKAWNIRA